MVDLTTVVADLRVEGDEIDALVRDLPAAGWAKPTPAVGWTIAHQVAHLAWTDQRSLLAATDVDAFQVEIAEFATSSGSTVNTAAAEGARQPPDELLAWWRAGRTELARVLLALPAGTKIPWYGPPMAPASMATARLMETWAHGQDVADALGVLRPPTGRLRQVAHIGVRTRDWAYLVRGRPAPADPFRVELTGPDGSTWTWGPEAAEQRVTGSALDFCLLTTQRVHRADTDLVSTGADADKWLDIAQAFAGPPGEGRSAGSRP